MKAEAPHMEASVNANFGDVLLFQARSFVGKEGFD
jgi:hypothetical protein